MKMIHKFDVHYSQRNQYYNTCRYNDNNNLNISLTAMTISGPIPSPGISVTVLRPPYLASGGASWEWEYAKF